MISHKILRVLRTADKLPRCNSNLLPRFASNVPNTSLNNKRKTTQLKEMINSPKLEFIMEAHSGLSARIVEESGFKGIWGSGLAISAMMGVRDSNEASWTQITDVLDFMADATSVPILLDADTGFGNFNNARRLVSKLEQIGVAGCCMEDKLFPKTNSLLDGRKQDLANIEEFALKIKACKDRQKDPDFIVVARVEALIAGWGMDEALRRAEAYRNAGADAILMHSKKSDPSDIEGFMKVWKNQGPVVVVPTKYYKTPAKDLADMGVSMVIFANHNMRTCITAMQKTTARIFKDKSLVGVESEVASVKEVFRLQRDDELIDAESKYLPVK
ncbi:phosphoenolpyruvate phosphomutase [Folsomia candida]|uniref:phosphoenolpyruvate mutase n=1 Tax=Folsomia candida TaxID=158441 RepID=A0A226ELT4_FOLCA|nr:phosphoenolpyruvate phosphomutase [Folsomia candida]OXA57701.1 Phosphoenolpyruvate phosphomutase [Folsomia candida]